jgi:autoinducer-2 kinase
VGKYALALDFGNGGGRTFFLDLESGHSFSAYQSWSYYSPNGDGFITEFNASEFFNVFCNLVNGIIYQHKISPDDVVGISVTSMRHTCVFLDKDGKEVYAGPNVDVRGLFYQDVIEENVDLDLFKLTGQWPPLLFMPARLAWFKGEEPDIFAKIKYALTAADWLIYKLSGVKACEPSLASATMLFDLDKKTWMYDVLESLDMDDIELPEIRNSGEAVGGLKIDIANKMGLKPGTPVVVGGSDTQLGLLACGAFDDGDLSVVAGTSTPVMLVSSKPVVGKEQRVWTANHVLPDRWVLEGNAQMGGLTWAWMKDNFQEITGKDGDETYRFMEGLASKVPAGSEEVFASLGSEISNIQELSTIRPSLFMFPKPTRPMNLNPPGFGHFIRATLENIAYAIRGNAEQLEAILKKKSNNLRVTGGMSKSQLWLEILSSIIGKPVIATEITEGTSVGCAICAAVGAGYYNNLKDGVKAAIKYKKEVKPNDKIIDVYNSGYNRWKEIYSKITDL